MQEQATDTNKRNLILVDAAFVDKMIFDETVQIERIYNRRVPNADLGRWLHAVCIDGQIASEADSVEVIFVTRPEHKRMKYIEMPDVPEHDESVDFKVGNRVYKLRYDCANVSTHDEITGRLLQIVKTENNVGSLVCVADNNVAYGLMDVTDALGIKSCFILGEMPNSRYLRAQVNELIYSIFYSVGILPRDLRYGD